MVVIAFAVCWVICGLIGSGWAYAYFHCKWPTVSDRRSNAATSLIFVFWGPVAVALAFLLSEFGRYGWWFWNDRDRADIMLAERSK